MFREVKTLSEVWNVIPWGEMVTKWTLFELFIWIVAMGIFDIFGPRMEGVDEYVGVCGEEEFVARYVSSEKWAMNKVLS